MALENELVDWAATRPAWQQKILVQLAHGEDITDQEIAEIAASLVDGSTTASGRLTAEDLPGSGAASHQTVTLTSIQPVAHVNALQDGEVLTFSDHGFTVVYGDNASGKSGYARLLKQVVRARHREPILSDIFKDRSADIPAATVSFAIDGVAAENEWPGDPNPALAQVTFYDEECGNTYISTESAVTYRPSALVIVDGLITVCDAVKDQIDRLSAANAQERLTLPDLPEGTDGKRFLQSLNVQTTDEQIDEACLAPPDVDAVIRTLAEEESRLRATDPGKERTRLEDLASRLSNIEAHLRRLDTALNDEAVVNLAQVRTQATELRAAMEVASSTSFESEPVHGVGSETWRALWEAARRYSETEAYSDTDYPPSDDGARCVLCQQELSKDARDRLHRFHTFMSQDTETKAAQAQRAWDRALDAFKAIDLRPAAVTAALTIVEQQNPDLSQRCTDTITAFETRKTAVLSQLDSPQEVVPDVPASPFTDLELAATAARGRAAAIDSAEFEREIDSLVTSRLDAEARRTLNGISGELKKEVARLRDRHKLSVARSYTDTTGITRKATELARDHVTDVIRDRFTRESENLRLDRITLKDLGGRKGQLIHRPDFLGAQQSAELPAVLSEGEQTALGLAGFLTEARFDQSRSAIVLDDPVTSLDHIRRSHVASRLAEFAKDCQVIVFTHDAAFVSDLHKAADHEQVDLTERSIERRISGGSVGICHDRHPWSVRDSKARLGQLEQDLAVIKRECGDWDQDRYSKEVRDWAGGLSETWERIINMDIVNQVFDRGKSEVRPRMFRILAKITEDDDREFQESYARCSQWAHRHDKSPDINYVAPDIVALESELALVRTWWDRVRRYGND